MLTTNPHGYDLTLGEHWENVVADYLTSLGYKSSRIEQTMIPSHSLRTFRHGYRFPRCPVQKPTDKSLYRSHQIDLRISVNGRQRNIELKALTSAAFRQRLIHIGACGKYDQKVIRVHDVLLVNQTTAEIWVCPPRETWLTVSGIWDSTATDYAVPKDSLATLEDWLGI